MDLDGAKLIMKFLDSKDHGWFQIGNDYKSPYKQYHGFFNLE